MLFIFISILLVKFIKDIPDFVCNINFPSKKKKQKRNHVINEVLYTYYFQLYLYLYIYMYTQKGPFTQLLKFCLKMKLSLGITVVKNFGVIHK